MKKRVASYERGGLTIFLSICALFVISSFALAAEEVETQGSENQEKEKVRVQDFVAGTGVEEFDEGRMNLDDEVKKARFSFERNQTKLRVARNMIQNTIAQLDLNEKQQTKLGELASALEGKMGEVDQLYKEYLNRITLFQNQKGSDPGRIEEVFAQAKEKKESILDLYRTTFRASLEEILSEKQKDKE